MSKHKGRIYVFYPRESLPSNTNKTAINKCDVTNITLFWRTWAFFLACSEPKCVPIVRVSFWKVKSELFSHFKVTYKVYDKIFHLSAFSSHLAM